MPNVFPTGSGSSSNGVGELAIALAVAVPMGALMVGGVVMFFYHRRRKLEAIKSQIQAVQMNASKELYKMMLDEMGNKALQSYCSKTSRISVISEY